MSYFRLLVLLSLLSTVAAADTAVAVLTHSGKAQIVRNKDKSRLTAVDGEMLFDGDSLSIPSGVQGSAEFMACSAGASKTYRLTSGEAGFHSGQVTGAAAVPGTASPCLLPEIEQDPAIGMMTERSLDSPKSAAPVSASDLNKLSSADRATLQSLDASLKQSPRNLTARVSRAVLLQRNGISDVAAAEFLAIGRDWPDEQWARTLGYTIATRKTPPAAGSGKLYAAFIGISRYEQKNIPSLHYADADANLFTSFMKMTRAQVFASDRLYLPLINENARSSVVRTKLKSFFDQAQASDSVLLYIAAHGVGATMSDSGYVILYDTHLESTYDNSLSMEWIRELFLAEASRVRHVFLFVDTCHADRIGPIRNFQSPDTAVGKAAKAVTDGKVFAMYASGPNQNSFENPKYGGGHGAFTYFLMRALNITGTDPDYRKADLDGNGNIDADELVSYVEDSVKADTHLKQSPKDDVRIDTFQVSTKLPGLKIAPCCGAAKTTAAAGVLRDPTLDARGIEWTPPPGVEDQANWEEKSQQVLYKYLQGDEIPQSAADYTAGLDATRRARAAAGESLYLEAREEFFTGRLLIFSKMYDDAATHLEKAIRMDPASPYAYNALGIAWLELGRYDAAEAAFNDAIRRAVNWAYPRHNLALVYLQRGDYTRAIATYRDAAQRMPQYSYLPYNLGLIYQRLNDEDQALQAYDTAFRNAPDRAAPLVALGTLMASRGRNGKARDYYRRANDVLMKNPEREVLINLRHNEGALEARSRGGLERARALWQANIDDADYLPSRLALARAFYDSGRNGRHPGDMAVALAQYAQIMTQVPENTGVRVEYARALYRAHRAAEAQQLIEQGLAAKPADATLAAALAQLRSGKVPQ